jgi:hypothetical protein
MGVISARSSVWLAISVLAFAGGAQAAELAGQRPFAGSAYGQQSDANAMPAYTQSFSVPAGSTLESITWWGYHGVNSMGAAYDNFVVALDGVVYSGTLAVDDSSPLFSKYTLAVAPTPLAATSLSILNDSPDVEWFWQSAESTGSGPHASDVAFSLQGESFNAAPAASTHALMLAGLLGLAAARRRRR